MDVRQLPGIGRVFIVLAAVVLVAELWPIVNAWTIGADEWWSEFPNRLPGAARAAAVVALPAAVAWARPTDPGSNAWLWKGAVIVAAVQALRYPAGLVQGELLAMDGDMPYLAGLVLSMLLALLTVLGVWALSEGLKDAGGRATRSVLILVAVLVLALMILVLGPSFLSGVVVDLSLLVGVVSIVSNGLFLLAQGVLAARAVTGALGGAEPRQAWRIGALAAVVLLLIPVISLLAVVVAQLGQGTDLGLLARGLSIATFFGWPLFAFAVSAGMGRLPIQRTSPPAAGRHRLHVSPRHVPAPMPD